MNISWKVLLALAAIVVAGAFIWGGRYTISAQGNRVYVVDRFTGSVRVCTAEECKSVPNDPWVAVKTEPIPPPQSK